MILAPFGMRSGQARRIGPRAASSSSTRRTVSTRLRDGKRRRARPPRARCAATRRPGSRRAGSAAPPARITETGTRRDAPVRRPATVSTAPCSMISPSRFISDDDLVDVLEPARGRAGLRHAARLGRVIAGSWGHHGVLAHTASATSDQVRSGSSDLVGRQACARSSRRASGGDVAGVRRVDGGHARAVARRGARRARSPASGGRRRPRRPSPTSAGRRAELRHGASCAARSARPRAPRAR